MQQDEINNDLKHYMSEKNKKRPFWSKVFNNNKSKKLTEEEIKEDLLKVGATENISPEKKKELENMEQKIEEVNKVEEEVTEKIAEEHEGLLKKFFKKLRSKEDHEEEDATEEVLEVKSDNIVTESKTGPKVETQTKINSTLEFSSDQEELKEMLKRTHSWITQLDPEKLQEFKNSDDFKLYTRVLKKHELIK